MEHTASEYLEELNSLATLFQIQDLDNSDICLLISLKLSLESQQQVSEFSNSTQQETTIL